MLKYPGARWYGIGGNGRPCNPRACSWHEAVTTAGVDGIAGWVSDARACHGFIGQDGDAGQYADFGEAVNGVKDDNGSVLTWETWDGLLPATNRSPDGSFGPNDRPWTPQQAERIADVMAWMVDALGIPLRLMEWTNERGHGPHRLGVRNPDGAVRTNTGPASWTAHDGKQCPGDQRVRQLPAIIARAQVIYGAVKAGAGWLPTGPVNLAAALNRGGGTPPPPQPTGDPDMAQLFREPTTGAIYAVGPNLFRHLDGPGLALGQKYGLYAKDAKAATRAELDKIRAEVLKPNTGQSPPPAPPAATYTVKAGDSLGKIAAANRTTVDALAKLNGITNPDNITEGQVLKLPKA